MPVVDNDSVIRDRAYMLWEQAGQPSGLEHEHWAEARRQIEMEAAAATPIRVFETTAQLPSDSPPVEIARLRQALYTPEPFSFELFGTECPDVDSPVVLHRAA